MAHESFEDAEVAAVVNEHTVPVKVDREERPDIDAVYMEATQAMTGQGGWPMTVFATPDGEPFFCGTYFPRAAFANLVEAVATAWRDQRSAVVEQGRAVVAALAGPRLASSAGEPVTADVLDAAAAVLHREHDTVHGGFGTAPKFPPAMSLEFLLRHWARTDDRRSLAVVEHTCARMARGGMYDQLAGGFARYSVDERWLVPHFEKMLYDNALLLRVYTHLWRATGDPLARRVADETAAFLLGDLRTTEGGFASALDADTDGVEGATYVWTPAQLREELGAADGEWSASLLGVTDAGTFEHGSSVLQLATDPSDVDRWRRIRERLLEARRRRPQPARDDKIVAAWNGLAVVALAEHGMITETQSSVDAAVAAGRLLADVHRDGDGRLRRVSKHGRAGEPAGVLEDYGCVAEAACTLHQVTGDGQWLDMAGALLDDALDRFADGAGALYDTAHDAEPLIRRPQDPTDNATPSGTSAVVTALISFAALTASSRHREAAERALASLAPALPRHARFFGWVCAAGEALVDGPRQVAIVGDGPAAERLRTQAWHAPAPGAVVVAGPPDAPGVPLLADRPLVDGSAAAYVCRGFVCDRPVTSPDDLAGQLRDTPIDTRDRSHL